MVTTLQEPEEQVRIMRFAALDSFPRINTGPCETSASTSSRAHVSGNRRTLLLISDLENKSRLENPLDRSSLLSNRTGNGKIPFIILRK